MTRKEELTQALLKAIREPVTSDIEFQRTLMILVMKLFNVTNPEELIYSMDKSKEGPSVIDKVLALLKPGIDRLHTDCRKLETRIDHLEDKDGILQRAIENLSLCITEQTKK